MSAAGHNMHVGKATGQRLRWVLIRVVFWPLAFVGCLAMWMGLYALCDQLARAL